MKWLFVAVIFLFSFGQVGRISIPGIPAYFYLYELLFFPFLLAWICMRGGHELMKYFNSHKYGILFLLVTGLSLLTSMFFYQAGENIIAFLYFLRLSLYIVWIMLAIEVIKSTGINAQFFTIVLCCYIGGLFGSAVLQYWFYPNFGNIAYMGWDPHIERLVGIFFEPHIAASIYGLCGFCLLFFYGNRKQMVILAAAVFLGVMLFFTYSRLVMTAFTFILLFFLFRTQRYSAFPAILCIALLLFFLPKGSHESINLYRFTSIASRQTDIKKGWQIAKKNLVSGIGYNHIRFEKDKLSDEPLTEIFNPSHSSASFHSSFMIVLVTGGLIGLACYLLWLVEIGRLSAYHTYMVLFLSLSSIGDNVLLHPFIMFLFPVLGVYTTLTHRGDMSR
jgi:hypothetical protein